MRPRDLVCVCLGDRIGHRRLGASLGTTLWVYYAGEKVRWWEYIFGEREREWESIVAATVFECIYITIKYSGAKKWKSQIFYYTARGQSILLRSYIYTAPMTRANSPAAAAAAGIYHAHRIKLTQAPEPISILNARPINVPGKRPNKRTWRIRARHLNSIRRRRDRSGTR